MTQSTESNSFEVGPYTVRCSVRPDNPAWPQYIVMLRGKIIGKQFSRPSLEDCRWLERHEGVYATESRWIEPSRNHRISARRVKEITELALASTAEAIGT